MIMIHNIDHYLSLPYTIEIIRDDEETWFARVLELPGCMTEGDSVEDAAEMIQDAMRAWLEIALEDGRTIPEPRSSDEYSGRFVVRLPKSLHRDLVEASKRDGVSLNAYINTELARAICR
jgi:antitoxin HicB